MITLTKYPESCPMDIVPSAIGAYHPWEIDNNMCVKLYMKSGTEFLVYECMQDIRKLLSPDLNCPE